MKHVGTVIGACWLGLFAVASPAAGELKGADWPAYLGPQRTSVSLETGFLDRWGTDGPNVAWRKQIGTGFASMAAVGDHVYAVGNVGGDHEVVYCLDAATGEEVWTTRYASELVDKLHEGGASSTPVVHEDGVYVVSRVGEVRRLDAETGQVTWTLDLRDALGMEMPEWGFTSSVLAHEGVGYVQAGATVAFDLETGRVAWASQPYEAAYTTPHPFEFRGRTLIATLNSYGLVILDPEDGSEIASHEWETRFDASAPNPLAVDDGLLFVSTGYQTGCALFRLTEAGELEMVYRGQELAAHMDTPVLADGYIYGFDGNHNRPQIVDLVCLDAETGEEKWRHNDFGCGTVIAADDTLIILSDDGELATAELTPEGFRQISRGRILDGRCWSAPVLAHGRLFARDADGELVCVDLRPR